MGQTRTLIEGWPALMTTAMAASYLSLDETSFARAAARLKVCSVDLEPGLIRWRKSDLDKLVKRLAPTPTALGGGTDLRPCTDHYLGLIEIVCPVALDRVQYHGLE